MTYGERANAIATPVLMRACSVCSATRVSAGNGLCSTSATESAS